MIKLFIGSSLADYYIGLRKELINALTKIGFEIINWEKDRPGGKNIINGERVMIENSDACVFLLGSYPSTGTIDEYSIALEMKKHIVLVDVTPFEGKDKVMDPQLDTVWKKHRDKGIITLTWSDSDEIADQIQKGLDASMLVSEPPIEVFVRRDQITKEPRGLRIAFSISLKNKLKNKSLDKFKLYLKFKNRTFDWGKTIFLTPNYRQSPDCRWSRGNPSKYQLLCTSKTIFPMDVQIVGSVQLLVHESEVSITFSIQLYTENLEAPIEENYLIHGFLERIKIKKVRR